MKNIVENSEKKIYQLFSKLIIGLLLMNAGFLQAQAPSIEWQKSLGGSSSEGAEKIKKTTDGGYIAAGSSLSNNGDVTGNNGGWDIWIVKTNASGQLLWQKSLGGPESDFATDIIETADGGYIAIGESGGNGGDVTGNHGDIDVWIVKLSSTGNLQWQKSLGGSGWDVGNAVIQIADGSYVIAGFTDSNDGNVSGNHGQTDAWLVKIDINGDIIWQKTYGGSLGENAYGLQETSTGGFIVAGSSNSTDGDVSENKGEVDFWIFNLDSSGNLLWERSYGGTGFDYAFSAMQTLEGGFIVSGNTNSNDGDVSGNNGELDFWIIKLNSSGNMEWQRPLGGSNNEGRAKEILQVAGQGYIIIGSTNSNNGDVNGNHGSYDMWVARLNANGILQWQKCLGGSNDDLGRSIQATNDGGYILAGSSSSTNGDVTGNHGSDDFWIVKLSPDTLDIEEFTENSIALYPNPVKNILHIETSENIERVHIYNLLGQTVYDKIHQGTAVRLNTESFSKGLYVVEIISGNHLEVYKILKE